MKKFAIKLSALLLGSILLAGCIAFVEYDPPDPNYVAVEAINGVPTGGVKDFALVLKATVSPAKATNKKIIWAIVNDGGTHSILNRNVLTAAEAGTVTLRAMVKNGGKTRADNFVKDFNIEIFDTFYPVTNIIDIPVKFTVEESPILTGNVRPPNATNKTITWEVSNAGTTGAVLDGNTLTATAEGTVIVTATIQNGKMPGIDYTQFFAITVLPPPPPPPPPPPNVYIPGLVRLYHDRACYWMVDPETGTTLTYLTDDEDVVSAAYDMATENGKMYIAGKYVNPDDDDIACYWVVDGDSVTKVDLESGWSDASAIAVSNGVVYVTGSSGGEFYYWTADGSVTRTELTVPPGANVNSITAIAAEGTSVYITGYYNIDSKSVACYWDEHGTVHDLPIAGSFTSSAARNITIADGDVYIVGNWRDDLWNGHLCYWKNGTQTELPNDSTTPNDGGDVLFIAAEDGNVYAAGYYNDGGYNQHLCYWNNGAFELSLSGVSWGPPLGLTVLNGIIYILGIDNLGEYTYWVINGADTKANVPRNFVPPYAAVEPYGIVVVEK